MRECFLDKRKHLSHTFLMTGKDTIKTIITDSQERDIPVVWKRNLDIPLDSGKIITLAGVRRSGKTYHLYDLINKLRARGVQNERILYFNFEDERLHLAIDELDLILQSYRELHPDLELSDCYFFFDEIQEIEGWEKFIARVYSSISQRLFITGSNSKLLSKEISTALRGRTVTFEVYPLSFSEFSRILHPKLSKNNSKDKAIYINLFDRFLHRGGFPEILNQPEELKDKILQEYFNVMVFRDIVERFKITNSSTLKYFCKRIIGASAGEFSVNKIYHELKSQGYQVSKDTLYLYQGYVDDIYLNRFVNKYSHSIVKAEGSQKKTYVIDTGLGASLDYKLSQDLGRLLETTVALELLKQGRQIAYQQNGSECDFVVIEKGVVTASIQVALDTSETKTMEREVRGLVDSCKKFKLKEGFVLTMNDTDIFDQDGISVNIMPVWQYFS